MDKNDKLKRITLRTSGINRLLNHPLRVKGVGYLRNHYVKGPYSDPESINFGITLGCEDATIVRKRNGKIYKLKVPCAGISTPGDIREIISRGRWDEIYISYPAALAETFRNYGVRLGESHEIELNTKITALCRQMVDLCKDIYLPGNADRLDVAAESLIFECILNRSKGSQPGAQELSVRKIASFIGLHYLEPIDFAGLLQKHALTYRTFLRAWRKMFGNTPQQHIMELKLNDACNELRESNLRIAEIAEKLNFSDPLYFSRLFARKIGLSPSNYRRQYKQRSGIFS